MNWKRNAQSVYVNVWRIVISLFILSACENEIVENYEPQLNVLAVLNDLTQIQTVYVDRTYSMSDTAGGPIDDAIVILSDGNIIDTMEFSPAHGYYWTVLFSIAPLSTYELTVAREGFDTLNGTTTVPAPFVIVHPFYNDTISFQDTIVFTASAGAAVYGCILRHELTNFATLIYHEPDPLDSVMQLPIAEHLESCPSGLYTIYIAAYDSNFHEYHFEYGDSILQAGVTGGVGLFGSTHTEVTAAYIFQE